MLKSDELLLHPKTLKNTGYFLSKPVGPLLVLGVLGSGKLMLAESIAGSVLGLKKNQELASYPYFIRLKRAENKQDISIDDVRRTTHFMRLKTPGKGGVRSLVLIEDAQFLSLEAQNALLKILEEPSESSLFILTAPNERSLLPTIVSRCQQIWMHSIPLKQATKFYSGHSFKKIESAWRLSQGGASLLDALIKREESHPLRQSIGFAKSFLRLSRYERLLLINKLNSNREEASLLLESLSKVFAALHRSAIEGKRPNQAQKLMADRKLVIDCASALENNTNSRLVFLSLILNLRH